MNGEHKSSPQPAPTSPGLSLQGLVRSTLRNILAIRAALSGLSARLYLRLWGVQTGPGLSIRSRPVCYRHATGTIRLGRDVCLNNRVEENLAGLSHPCILFAGPSASLHIGDGVGLSGAVVYSVQEITIGDHVQVGVGACIYDTDHHPMDPMARREHRVEEIAKAPVHIETDVWIGARAIILKGVRVGARSVVAAGAVVTRDVPADSIVAGVPARVIGTLDEAQRAPSLESAWLVRPGARAA